MSARALNRTTLARQMLLAREKVSATAVIERLVGMQAQWPKPPFIGLWSRLIGFQREELVKLLEAKKVVRATMMRTTLHLISAKDYVKLRPAVQPVLSRAMSAVLKDRVKPAEVPGYVEEARAFFAKKPRTFTELRDHLMSLHPKGDERAMGYIVRTRLPLVQVPSGGTWGFPADSEFALADAWIGKSIANGDDTPPDDLVLRYLAAFGPASAADAQAWSGFQGLGAVLERMRPKLRVVTDERGRELFDAPDAEIASEDVAAPARFLPEFDNLIVGRSEERFLAKGHRSKVFLSGLRVIPTVLVDGLVAATWKTERKKNVATLAIEPFAAFAKKVKAEVEEEGEALLRFIEPDAKTFELGFAKTS